MYTTIFRAIICHEGVVLCSLCPHASNFMCGVVSMGYLQRTLFSSHTPKTYSLVELVFCLKIVLCACARCGLASCSGCNTPHMPCASWDKVQACCVGTKWEITNTQADWSSVTHVKKPANVFPESWRTK